MKAQRGFTLVEILVVMVMLSLLVLGMASALYSAAQTEQRVDHRLERLEQVRTISAFLRQLLGQVSVRDWTHPMLPPGGKFQGLWAQPESIEWVGVMPARPGVFGRHFFRLAVEDAEGGPALVLRYVPWQAHAEAPDRFPAWDTAAARVLVPGVTAFAVQSRSDWPTAPAPPEGWPQGWQDGWPVLHSMPTQVLLKLADTQGEWPTLALTLYATPSAAAGDGFVIGGDRQ